MKKMKSLSTRFLSLAVAGIMAAGIMAVTLLPETAFLKEEKAAAKVEAAGTSLSNPRIEKVDSTKIASGQKVTWDCVWFGNYPQTEVVSEEDTDRISALEEMNTNYDTKYEKVSAEKFKQIESAKYRSLSSDGTMSDAVVGTEKYRRIKYSDATDTTGAKYDALGHYDWKNDKTSYHYFKYEPIKWRVLNVNGGKAFLLADIILDDQIYYPKTDESITWEKSSIRSFLNNYGSSVNAVGNNYSLKGFLINAFNTSERSAIEKTTLTNADNLKYETEGGKDTNDKIFLLSESDVYETDAASSYGFVTDSGTNDEARRSKSSTYAYAMGTSRSYSTAEGKNYVHAGDCSWWLRSPGYHYSDSSPSNTAVGIEYFGLGRRTGYYVTNKFVGVRPAFYLNLSSSDLYTLAGTVCSDGTAVEQKAPVCSIWEEVGAIDDGNYTANDSTDKKTKWEISVNAKSLTMRKKQTNTKLKVSMTEGDMISKVMSTDTKLVKAQATNRYTGTLKLTAGKKTGTAFVKIYLESGLSVSVKVKVQSGKVKTKKVKLPVSKLTLKKGKTYKLQPEITPITAQDKITYRSSNKKVASVNSSGKIKAKKKGTAKITVKSGKKKAVLKVKVK